MRRVRTRDFTEFVFQSKGLLSGSPLYSSWLYTRIYVLIIEFQRSLQKCPPIRKNINNTKCDFQGVKLKTITGISAPYLMVKTNYENSSTFYNQTETYDITSQCYGLMKDIIETLSTACNFRYEIHIREDRIFGGITEYENGTIVKTGMYNSLLDQFGK